MECALCVHTVRPTGSTSALALVSNGTDVENAWGAHSEWSRQHAVPGLTSYCATCRRVTWLRTLDYPRSAVDDLVRSLAWKDALCPDTSHAQTSDLGHAEQSKSVLRCGEESLNSTTPGETRSVGAKT